ncbi:hypothetical protein ELG76_04115 [Rhizobium leguminosarum]|uniref:hypothetical protein n=1 Tax=Rhizobium leguminosarum TaxID=384 RepID=UPI00102F79CD|nr:hypothetical protein [Rhizobium leguminosarum]TBG78605.1 hypothetical protein ELG76_04115 [Rhizobium leguminosarum]
MRFIKEVALLHTSDDCLKWPFSTNAWGYGKLSVDGKIVAAHRYVCELVRGASPTPEHEAAHSCGKGHEGCISPEHLSWKTRVENEADKLVHGTRPRGERHAKAKLTEADVREILAMKGKETQCKLAKRFSVSDAAISRIYAGQAWACLSEEATA